MTEQTDPIDLLSLTARIVSAQISSRTTPVDELPTLIQEVYASLKFTETRATTAGNQKPAVPITRSITPSHIICLEDGQRFKMLKRHLRTAFNMTPGQYRQKWGLADDYPMVAPNYAEQRSTMAKKFGLGRKRTTGRRSNAK